MSKIELYAEKEYGENWNEIIFKKARGENN